MHRLTDSILNIGNAFQNKNVTIHERFCVSPPPYYLDWFEKYFPNVTLNQDDGTFTLKYTNGIQGKNPSGRQWNRLLDEVVTVMKYKRIVIDNGICIKILPDGTISYITVSTDDVTNTTNNVIYFSDLRKVFQ